MIQLHTVYSVLRTPYFILLGVYAYTFSMEP